MSDMTWRKADGSTGEYSGPLMDLGHGIPRPMRDHGARRAVFDLAFGYVSGFPVRDVLAFSFRSLFPQRGVPTAYAEAVPGGADVDVRTRASALDGWARTAGQWPSSPPASIIGGRDE
jgi:hypothetical protein